MNREKKVKRDRSLDDMNERGLVCFVEELNMMAAEATSEMSFILQPFRYVSDGCMQAISFSDESIWDSENSDWDEDECSLREHIISKVCFYIESLASLENMRRELILKHVDDKFGNVDKENGVVVKSEDV